MPSNMVTKAYLRMSLYTKQGTRAVPVYVKEVLGDWSSQTITWNNQPSLGEHDVDVAIIPANAGVLLHNLWSDTITGENCNV